MQDHFTLTKITHNEKSNVAYIEVMDAVADCRDTIMQLVHSFREKFIVGQGMRWLVVAGDAKLYEVIKSVKFEYGKAYSLCWGFHLLMNYQKALMKPYYDTGLKSLAQAAGYPVAAIQSCSLFQRTHHFILEAWEAMYRVMILKHIQHCKENSSRLPATLIQEIIKFVHTKPHNNFPISHCF